MNLASTEDKQISELPKIPEKLQPYAEEIKKTAKDAVQVEITFKETPLLWNSKLGGRPYLPLNEKYPCNSQGDKLAFFAQINFSEMPHLDGFPTKGILVFFLDIYNSEIYGMNYEDYTDQDGFRVLYFEEVLEDENMLNKETDDHDWDDSDEELDFPFDPKIEYLFKFKRIKQYVTSSDYRFKDLKISEDVDEEDSELSEDFCLIDMYQEELDKEMHIIGGYPSFIQWDPREENGNKYMGYESLFHIASESIDHETIIMWGDVGFANFMIKPEDLAKKDFSKVLFMWDCS